MRKSRLVVAAMATMSIAMGLVGCAATESGTSFEPGTSEPPHVQMVDGYPIDRSIEQLVQWPSLDTVAIVESLEFDDAVELNSNQQPGPIRFIVTPVTATVVTPLLGSSKQGERLKFVIAGGAVGSDVVKPSAEIAPSIDSLKAARRLIVAGSISPTQELGPVLDPLFIYSLDADGTATSLLEGGGRDPIPTFTLEDLVARLATRSDE